MKTVTFDETEWQLVPKEPTEDMEYAGLISADDKDRASWMTQVYRAMLKTAPPPPTK